MPPNVLFVVWDACRLDAAREHAPTLNDLAAENLWFENAITPTGQSLGSHVSMFTGEYPHEHEVFMQTDSVEQPLPLVADLASEGYSCYGVSGNGFASAKYGFDRGFDEFYNTQGVTVSPEGLDVHGYAREVADETGEFEAGDVDGFALLRRALAHDHPVGSVANVAGAALSELGGQYEWLRRIPHPRFDRYNEFCFDPADNTRLLGDVFDRAANDDDPFFAFANYMDPHHPYAPPERYQQEYCGQTFSYRELSELADATLPWHYLERLETGTGLDESTLETVQNLYRGEVRSADDHLGRLFDHLERTGLREETVVVVVADHGENLGERNRMGERHMGHVRSASDHHLRVPMVVAHPELDGRTVEEYVSLKDVYHLLTDERGSILASGGRDLSALPSHDGVVTAAVPRATSVSIAERYPAVSDVVERDIVAAYEGDWKVVVSTNGDEHAWEGDAAREVKEVPEQIVDAAKSSLKSLVAATDDDQSLTESEQTQLEALGYL